MYKAEAIAAAVLLGAATLASAQGASLGSDASPATRTAAPASAAASGFPIDQKGVNKTGNPSVGKAATVTPGGGALPQSRQVSSAGGQALDPATTQRGSGSNLKPHTNSGDGDRAERARLVAGDYGKDAAATDSTLRGKPSKEQKTVSGDSGRDAPATDSTLRGKPTKEQKTFNESRSNNTRTTSPIVNSGSGRTPVATMTPREPPSSEAKPASTTSIFK